MKKQAHQLLLSFLLVFLALPVVAQWQPGLGKFTKKKRYWSVGFQANTMHYFGDIVPKNTIGSIDLDFTRPNLGFYVQKRFFPMASVRLAATWGQLAGEDHTTADPTDLETGGFYRYKRNLHFRNNIYDLTAVAVIDFIGNNGLAHKRPDFPIPYMIAGVGVFYHNPQALRPTVDVHSGGPFPSGPEWVNLRPLKTEGQENAYSPIGISFPVGLGVRYKLTEVLDIGFEMGYRFTLTDYIDDVSGDYIDLGNFDDPLARALHDRSAEPIALYSGESRDPQVMTYTSEVNGSTYTVVNGYGMPLNKRGNNDNDAYLVTGFHIAYIFSYSNAPKFR